MTTLTIPDGALGLEATHVWQPPAGRIAGGVSTLTLNDRAALGSGPAYILKSISGLHSLPEIEDARDPATGRHGEVVYMALARGKNVTYEGVISARTLQELRNASNKLRKWFGLFSSEKGLVADAQPGEGKMTIVPKAAYDSAQLSHYFSGRVLSLEIGDVQAAGPGAVPTPYQRPFVLTLRLGDPRLYYAGAQASSLGNVTGATVFLDNLGSAPTDPIWTVTGVLDSVTLVKDADLNLHFNNLGWVSSDTIIIDFRQRKAYRYSDSLDLTAKLDPTLSNWWDPGIAGFEPGTNQVGATSGAVSGTYDVYWRMASW